MKKGTLMVLASYVLWGLLTIFWKLLADIDSFYVLCCRIVFSLAVSAALLPLTGGWAAAKAVLKDRKLLFREKLTAAQWVSVIIAAIGVAAPMVMAGQFPYLALLCGLSFALYGAVKKKANVPGGISTFIETLLVAPIALAVALVMELNAGPISTGALSGWRLLLLPAAGAVTFLPVFLYSSGIPSTPMSLSGVLMYINPTLQLLCGLVLFNETMSSAMLVTFVCVWVATIIYLVSGAVQRKKAAGTVPAAEVEQ